MQPDLTHAGGVVLRVRGASKAFLLVRSSNGAHWVLPKGHIERGESPEEAALRELREEAGVIGSIVRSLGTWTFQQGAEGVRVVYYLFREDGRTSTLEQREQRWCSLEEAVDLLDFDEAREAVRSAAQ